METIALKDVEALIRVALEEDIGEGDVTSQAIVSPEHRSEATIIAKQEGVICGTDVVRHVFALLDAAVIVTPLVDEGAKVHPGDAIARCVGPTTSILAGERTALNFLQRMSGIATHVRRVVEMLGGSGIRLLDTRKTIPGFRKLDKYAVRTGGGTNHRMGLYDMVMIKDNHIRAAGGIARAVALVREHYGSRYLIEVEAQTIDEAKEAARAGVDIIMLDNMNPALIKEAVNAINGRAKIEVSGMVNEQMIRQIIGCRVDFISMGAITHSVKAFDCSLEFSR